ncbi:MAG: isopentenyl-diphosphate Delta-isomerase [Actinomycetota bacterium]|nr:isopentenyl-diphosphate Delta-isomerase [Actinomycetota bacterium]
MTTINSVPEQVVLCGPDGDAIGTADKQSVHHADTPLHLAFSCYVFDVEDRLLVTRRAYTKKTWPGVRTNSCCGHPAPGEAMQTAIGRRLLHELGIIATSIDLLIPTFRYHAAMTDATVENELCPTYRATVIDNEVAINAGEVADAWWMPWTDVLADVDRVDQADRFSPWSLLQVETLRQLYGTPLTWPTADAALLPAAARSSPTPPP